MIINPGRIPKHSAGKKEVIDNNILSELPPTRYYFLHILKSPASI
jgi:hypothetical protein